VRIAYDRKPTRSVSFWRKASPWPRVTKVSQAWSWTMTPQGTSSR